MAWLTGYTHRFPIAVDNTSGGTADKDVSFVIPKGLRDFWDNVLSNGYDLRVTKQDGTTELEVKRHVWDKAAFSATIYALGDSGSSSSWAPPAANEFALLWLYCGNSGASDTAVGTAASSPLTGYLTPSIPRVGTVIPYAKEAPEASIPAAVVTKAAADQLHVWVDFSAALANLPKKISSSSASSIVYEEMASVNVLVHSGGADQAGLYTETSTRFAGRGLVRMTIKSGTSGTDYTGVVTLSTANPDEAGTVRVLVQRFLLKVRTVAE